MITNGQKLADKDFFKRCVDAGLTHIHVSLHSYRREVHDFITQYRGAWDVLVRCLENVPDMGITSDINCVINVWNADHLHENVRWICENFPFIRHFVWNNLDPSMGRAETNRDTAHRLADFELSLARAMRYLHRTGRSFRVERVPLCYMTEFADCSTETRKIVKGEERIVHFLDDKGTVRQTDFRHPKSEVCRRCSLDDICGGLFELGDHYDLGELHPVFVDKDDIVRKIRASEP
jgi:MoaA/NifB/PqqE/SkfB family radical SAM enzyme